MDTSMGSGLVPLKTVHAVAVIPRFTSRKGKNPPVDGGGPASIPVGRDWESLGAVWASAAGDWGAAPGDCAADPEEPATSMQTANSITAQVDAPGTDWRGLVSFRYFATSIEYNRLHWDAQRN
jgi:hypothetical protein